MFQTKDLAFIMEKRRKPRKDGTYKEKTKKHGGIAKKEL